MGLGPSRLELGLGMGLGLLRLGMGLGRMGCWLRMGLGWMGLGCLVPVLGLAFVLLQPMALPLQFPARYGVSVF